MTNWSKDTTKFQFDESVSLIRVTCRAMGEGLLKRSRNDSSIFKAHPSILWQLTKAESLKFLVWSLPRWSLPLPDCLSAVLSLGRRNLMHMVSSGDFLQAVSCLLLKLKEFPWKVTFHIAFKTSLIPGRMFCLQNKVLVSPFSMLPAPSYSVATWLLH